MTTDQSIFSSEERPANLSRLPAFEEDWTTRAVLSPCDSSSLLELPGQDGLFGKTYREFSRLEKATTSARSSRRWLSSGMGTPGECLMLNTSEFPSDVVESSLSDILETGDVPRRFYLTPRACAGILRRAEKRGKKLPEHLREALEGVARAPTMPKLAT